jgi:teichuronic acid biosynthesis glycosyltransferase TuaC
LFVSPHAQYFVGDQIRSVGKYASKVSVLIPSPFLSGLVVRLPWASNRFASLKRARDTEQGTLAENLVRARYFDLPGRFGRHLTYSLAARASVRSISQSQTDFDVIHSHFLRLHGFIGSALKKSFRKPLVVSAYGGDAYSLPFTDSFNRKLAVSVIRGADRLIAVSRTVAQNLYRLGAEEEKVRIIPTGFDSRLFQPTGKEEARISLGLPVEKQILLTVANLVPQKGHTYLLDSLKKITGSRSNFVLVIVGGGELERDLRQKTADLGLGDAVIFAGPRPHEEIATWINACDLFVLPSVSEGSPTVLTEVMACGKPIVATNVGGIPDILKDGDTGYLVPPREVDDLADAVLRALDRSWSEEEIRKHALPFSWDTLASEIVEVYSEITRP